MKHAPGSFSKNFAWHGTGLRKLQTAINAGYGDKLAPVDRQIFRADCGLTGVDLIPINFFLHNKNGQLSVDELVFQAIERSHSVRFDRLSLFALHLNRVGGGRDALSGRQIVSRPAMWANEFVRERLWFEGAWRSNALLDASLDAFLNDRMKARAEVRTKCRTNYRHMFQLCDYWPAQLGIINSGAEQWIASALFLTWDRHILDGGAGSKSALLEIIETDEIAKLLGVPEDYALKQADQLSNLYVDIGRLDRFDTDIEIPTVLIEASEEAELSWLDQEESDEAVQRRMVERLEQKRDRKKATDLKKLYNNTCMFCDVRLQVSRDRFYSEAAHIRPLGKPHNGPDKKSNMLVLCPNHHLQFDGGILRLRMDGSSYKLVSKIPGHPLNNKKVVLRHRLDDTCVTWHWKWFGSKRS
ncbi:MAG: HNH endonuclease [Firmicutes bacterium]|nr:HNH endonuclease [Bacillota bacterium]